jgi:hypothetical protein
MDDTIKRSDAIRIAEYPHIGTLTKEERVLLIMDIPSAEKQGEWLFKEITDDYHVIGQCSICKERRRIDNFCPNCGAKMSK